MNEPLIEGNFGDGAIPIHPIHRAIRKAIRPTVGRGIPNFDWTQGYDVRDTIGPIVAKNQGTSSSCSGQAGSYFLEVQRRLQKFNEGAISAKSIYSPIAFPGGGTTVNALSQQIATAGGNLETAVPSYNLMGQPLTEPMFIDRAWETEEFSKDALHRAGYTIYDIGENIDEVACGIRDWGAVIWEIQGKNNGTWLSAFPKPPTKADKGTIWQRLSNNTPDIWTHFMCAIGAKMIDGKKSILCLNSWGSNVGVNGVQNFQEDYFNSGFMLDCFTFIYDTHITPIDSSNTVWADIARWFQSQSWFSTA